MPDNSLYDRYVVLPVLCPEYHCEAVLHVKVDTQGVELDEAPEDCPVCHTVFDYVDREILSDRIDAALMRYLHQQMSRLRPRHEVPWS